MASLWQTHCDAALEIRKKQGVEEALGFLVGENFLNLLAYSHENIELRLQVQDFADRIRKDYSAMELTAFFKNPVRVGAQDDEKFQLMKKQGVFGQGPADWAGQLLIFEQARTLLLGKQSQGGAR